MYSAILYIQVKILAFNLLFSLSARTHSTESLGLLILDVFTAILVDSCQLKFTNDSF